jgi:hypothetical protein
MIEQIGTFLTEKLEPLASGFRSLNMPEPIVHWGHPLMMGIVIFVMGSFVGYTGWKGRKIEDEEIAIESRLSHRKVAPFLFLFLSLGYTGGILSLVMQKQPLLESPHFWTGSIAIFLLGLNGLISATKFGGNKESFKTSHAYIGTIALIILVVHSFLGIKLGLSI